MPSQLMQRIQHEPEEVGSIEAGLTLIPVTLLFLLLVQIVLTGSWQVQDRARLHDYVIKRQLGSSLNASSAQGLGTDVFILAENIDSVQEGFYPPSILKANSSYYYGVGKVTSYELESSIPTFAPFLSWFGNSIKLRSTVIDIE